MKKAFRAALAAILVYLSAAVPAAQASLWSERRRHLESMNQDLEPAVFRVAQPEALKTLQARLSDDPRAPMIYHFRDIHDDVREQRVLAASLDALFKKFPKSDTDL